MKILLHNSVAKRQNLYPDRKGFTSPATKGAKGAKHPGVPPDSRSEGAENLRFIPLVKLGLRAPFFLWPGLLRCWVGKASVASGKQRQGAWR